MAEKPRRTRVRRRNPDAPGRFITIHSRCAEVKTGDDNRTLICGRSYSHTGEHFDPDADKRWI